MQLDEKTLMEMLRNMETRLTSLEKNVNKPSEKTVHNSFYLNIKSIQTLKLEELSYHLDKLDVKELSGMLNIGNTFSPEVNEKQQENKSKSPPALSAKKNPSPLGEQEKEPDADLGLKSKKQNEAKNIEENPSDILVKFNGNIVPYKLINIQASRKPEKSLPSTFTIGDINIGTIEDASCVNFGNNFPTDFRSHKKHNQGFGNILGNHNDIHDILSWLEERDITEVFSQSQDEHPPEWLDMLVKGQEEDLGENETEDKENPEAE